ncbi:hypothetical protein [Cytobacillus sp. IB215665]|uniref:hypothetical protein n=1 Tax=Cytobacillus sp. IB215665 TaxID=3097357 RepID=UPI002A0CA9E6|nr:hypothetical protein [Cytobacillus sp. IB215665]MDX8367363.1 hypothetical protein [Cytobacillus sp. IB215665]
MNKVVKSFVVAGAISVSLLVGAGMSEASEQQEISDIQSVQKYDERDDIDEVKTKEKNNPSKENKANSKASERASERAKERASENSAVHASIEEHIESDDIITKPQKGEESITEDDSEDQEVSREEDSQDNENTEEVDEELILIKRQIHLHSIKLTQKPVLKLINKLKYMRQLTQRYMLQ